MIDEIQRAAFGQRVRDARVSKGWNQTELAEAAGVAPNTIGSIESGKRAPQPHSVARVLAALELDPEPQAIPSDLPADVELISNVVAQWLLAIPEGRARAAAVLDLVRFLGASVSDQDAAGVSAPAAPAKGARAFTGRRRGQTADATVPCP